MVFVEIKTKKDRIAHIKKMIANNDEWAKRALVVIYGFQEDSEKCNYSTTAKNGVGFTGADAEFLSKMAKTLLDKKYLSPKQLDVVKQRMVKYARQLESVSKKYGTT